MIQDNPQKDGKIFIEVPNCRRSKKDFRHIEGGYDGKIIGSHILYFTSDFFKKMNAEIIFYNEDEKSNFFSVDTEDNAECIRSIIDYDNLEKWLINNNYI